MSAPKTQPVSGSAPGSASNRPSTPPATEKIYSQVSSVNDALASKDQLGYELYVNALANFLAHPNTRAPLTCSIEGPWGSGKSSFMLQLRNRLKDLSPTCKTIEFNAWQYENQEEVWAAFALRVARSLRDSTGFLRGIWGDLYLLNSRARTVTSRIAMALLVLAWTVLLVAATSVAYWTYKTPGPQRVAAIKALSPAKEAPPADSAAHPQQNPPAGKSEDRWLEKLSQSPGLASIVLVLFLLAKIPTNLRKRLFQIDLETYIEKPDYKGKAAFVDAFSNDFSKMVTAYTNPQKQKIFVFIDDLDRCEAPKAADLMQAINILIGNQNPLIFILGLDRAKVASSIAYKFHDLIPYLSPQAGANPDPSTAILFGEEFLEKFIQLSFRLPVPSDEDQARRFINSLFGPSAEAPADAQSGSQDPDAPHSKEKIAESIRRANRVESGQESTRIRNVLMMVRQILDYSPRRIKLFLNAFRLALHIASEQGLLDVDTTTGEAEVTPERLGKFLALKTYYPQINQELESNSSFFKDLEDKVILGYEKGTLSEFQRALASNSEVWTLLRAGIVENVSTPEWQRQYSLANFPAWKFTTILAAVPPPTDGAPEEVPAASPAPVPPQAGPAAPPDAPPQTVPGTAGSASVPYSESFSSSSTIPEQSVSPNQPIPPRSKRASSDSPDGVDSRASAPAVSEPRRTNPDRKEASKPSSTDQKRAKATAKPKPSPRPPIPKKK